MVKTNTHCPIKTGDILLSDKRNTRFRVSSRAVFRGVVSLFFVVFIAHQKHGKHSANVFVLHSMQRARLDCYSRSYNGSYLSLFLFLFFLSFLSFSFFSFNYPSSPNKNIDQLEPGCCFVDSRQQQATLAFLTDAVN